MEINSTMVIIPIFIEYLLHARQYSKIFVYLSHSTYELTSSDIFFLKDETSEIQKGSHQYRYIKMIQSTYSCLWD